MSGSCPHCGGTDIGDVADDSGRCVCLDCDKTWIPKQRQRKGRRKR